jgi:hypothetical protein
MIFTYQRHGWGHEGRGGGDDNGKEEKSTDHGCDPFRNTLRMIPENLDTNDSFPKDVRGVVRS